MGSAFRCSKANAQARLFRRGLLQGEEFLVEIAQDGIAEEQRDLGILCTIRGRPIADFDKIEAR